MDLMNLSPFGQYANGFDDEFKKFFRGLPMQGSNVIVPSVDIYLQGNILVVEMPLPGIDIDKVSIEVDDNNLLTIKGKIEKKSEVDDKNYYRKETKIGSFFRTVALPLNIKSDEAKAKYEEGVLKVSFPKNLESKSKQIQIESSNK